MKPEDLLAQAGRLVNSSPKRPRDVDLRRAVSAAYYALFHAVARAGADLLVGTIGAQRSEQAWRQTYRALNHGDAKARCKALPSSFSQSFQEIADAFVSLQELRHSADYDPSARFSRKDAQSQILLAADAIKKMKNSATKDRRAFLIWVLLQNRK